MDRAQLIFRDLPHYLSGNGQYLYPDILRHFAARNGKHKCCRRSERIGIVQQIGYHWFRNNREYHMIIQRACFVAGYIFTRNDQLIFAFLLKHRHKINACCIIAS